jgi:hypothetical protein
MRLFSALAVIGLCAAGCTPNIPVDSRFAVSALRANGEIPPEFAAFNRYDGRVNPLLAEQSCATNYKTETIRSADAVPGEILTQQGYCERYWPYFAPILLGLWTDR